MGVYDTNDPKEIVKNPLSKILDRLIQDANNLYSLSEIDKGVLRGISEPGKRLKTEQEEKLAEALLCAEKIANNAAQMRHDLKEAKEKTPKDSGDL